MKRMFLVVANSVDTTDNLTVDTVAFSTARKAIKENNENYYEFYKSDKFTSENYISHNQAIAMLKDCKIVHYSHVERVETFGTIQPITLL